MLCALSHGGSTHTCVRRYGFRGFYSRDHKPIVLSSRNVDGIHLQGGTILGTSRGGANMDEARGPPTRFLQSPTISSTLRFRESRAALVSHHVTMPWQAHAASPAGSEEDRHVGLEDGVRRRR
jgi:hypothetical protein